MKRAVIFSLAFFVTLISKETIIIAVPLFAFFFFRDLYKKQNFGFWKLAFPVSMLITALYLFYFWVTTGDFLFRIHLLQAMSYINECRFDVMPAIFTWRRIGYELWRAMLLNGDMMIILPAVIAVIYRKKIETKLSGIDISAFIGLLLCSNFMTISFSSYVPLCHDARHFMFVLPFAAILAAPLVHAYFKTPQRFIILPVVMILAAAVMFKINSGNNKYLYLSLATLFAVRYATGSLQHKFIAYSFTAAFIIIFVSFYCKDFLRPAYPFYHDQKKLITRNFNSTTQATLYASDEMSAEISEFMLRFNAPFMQFYSKPADGIKQKKNSLYLINAILNLAAKQRADSLTGHGLELADKENNVYLYRGDSVAIHKMLQK